LRKIECGAGALSFSGGCRMPAAINLPIVPGGLSSARRWRHDFIATMVTDLPYSHVAIMDPFPFTISESEESDSSARHRWEGEGGNTGQLKQLPAKKTNEMATNKDTSNLAIAVLNKRYRVLLQAVRRARPF